MTDLRILWLTHKGEGYVGAPQTQYEFEQETAKLCECRFAGEGWKDYMPNESMDKTVARIYGDHPPDWVIDKDNNLHNKKPRNRRYKVGHFISDLHGKHHYNIHDSFDYADLLNSAGYDAVFMRYPLIYGTWYRPEIVYDRLEAEKQWVPWSIDPDRFRVRRKVWDVAFLGSRGHYYPLRNHIWEELHSVTHGYKVLRREAPKGTTYSRDIKSLDKSYLVGENYAKTLGESRILLFGCSVYRYALQKFFEAPACHCLVVSNRPGMAKRLGFRDGKTYVEVTEENWREKLLYLLENPIYTQKIARAGMKNVLMNHTHQKRAKQFLEGLERKTL